MASSKIGFQVSGIFPPDGAMPISSVSAFGALSRWRDDRRVAPNSQKFLCRFAGLGRV